MSEWVSASLLCNKYIHHRFEYKFTIFTVKFCKNYLLNSRHMIGRGENEVNIKLICIFNSGHKWTQLSERERERLVSHTAKLYSTATSNLKLHFSCVLFKRWFRLDLWYKLAIFAHYIATFCACTNLNRKSPNEIDAMVLRVERIHGEVNMESAVLSQMQRAESIQNKSNQMELTYLEL